MSEVHDLRVHNGRCQTLVMIEKKKDSVKKIWRDTIKIYLETHFINSEKPIKYIPIIRFVEDDFPEDTVEQFGSAK